MIFKKHPKFENYGQGDIHTIYIDINRLMQTSYNEIISMVEGEFHKTIDIKLIGQGAFGSGLFKDWVERIA